MRLPTLELLWIGSAKTLAFLIFLAVYVAVRERGRINCTDYFVAFLSVQFGPLVFAMPYGLLGEPFHPNTPAVAWSILAIMYFGLALGLGVSGGYGRYATSSISSCASTIKPEKTQGEIVLALVILFTMLLMTALYLLIPSIRSYLYDMARLVTGNWDYALYEQLRRVTYADDVAISELLARTRYSVGAALFVLAFSFWKWLRLNSILMFTGLLLFFLITASSLSKLPWITYFAYTFLVSAHLRQAQGLKFTSSRTITTFCLFLLLIYALLTLLYVIQYEQWELKDFFGEPLALASYRLFGIFYSGLLRYAEVYPAILPYTEGASIGILADVLDATPRSPATEVARAWLGNWQTTNPTLFSGAAWADFGMTGVFLYSVLVGLYLSFVNVLARRMHSPPVKAAFEAIVGFNAVVLVQIALPPALLTHGLLLFPFFFWIADRIARFKVVNVACSASDQATAEK